MEELMTTKEVAKYLRISITTIHNMIKRGDLHPAKIGKDYRFKRSDIEKMMEM